MGEDAQGCDAIFIEYRCILFQISRGEKIQQQLLFGWRRTERCHFFTSTRHVRKDTRHEDPQWYLPHGGQKITQAIHSSRSPGRRGSSLVESLHQCSPAWDKDVYLRFLREMEESQSHVWIKLLGPTLNVLECSLCGSEEGLGNSQSVFAPSSNGGGTQS